MPQQVGAERGQLRGAAQAGVEGRGEGEGELRVDGPAVRDPNQSPGPDTPVGALLGGVWTLDSGTPTRSRSIRLRPRASAQTSRARWFACREGKEEDLP